MPLSALSGTLATDFARAPGSIGVAERFEHELAPHLRRTHHEPGVTFLQTGSQIPGRPSMGAWLSYGLGSESKDLPGFIVLPEVSYPQGGPANWSNGFLPAHHQGTPLRPTGSPILNLKPEAEEPPEDVRMSRDLLARFVRDRDEAAWRQCTPSIAGGGTGYRPSATLQRLGWGEAGLPSAANRLGLDVVTSTLHVRSDPRLLEQLIRNLLSGERPSRRRTSNSTGDSPCAPSCGDSRATRPEVTSASRPIASARLGGMLDERKIELEPDFVVERVDAANRTLVSYDEREVPFDLLVTVPLNMGADFVARSGLGADELNYVPVDKHTLLSKAHDNLWAVGDASDIPASKAGSVAHFSVEIFVENFLEHIEGRTMTGAFDGHANCFVESGDDKALLIDFNYDTEPLPGKYPLPKVGPMDLLKETRTNHLGKLAFRWIYWNVLLPGRPIPLPALMSMAGKEVPTTAQNQEN